MTNHRVTAVLISAAVLLPASLAAQPSNAAVDRAVAAWSKVKTLGGTFEQTLTNPLVRSTATARGNFRQQQPNKLAIRFTDPAGDAIVSDGEFTWVYLQQAAPGQVMKIRGGDPSVVPVNPGQFLDAPARKFDMTSRGTLTIAGRATQAVELVPKKGAAAPFSRATVWIDDADGVIRQFEVVENSGLIRRIRLTRVDVNPAVSVSDFRFIVPKGTRVVER